MATDCVARVHFRSFSSRAVTRYDAAGLQVEIDCLQRPQETENDMAAPAVAAAAKKVQSKEKLKQLILVNYVEGEGNAKLGYRFVPAAGLSVQGQDANSAWKTIFYIVKMLGMQIDVVFLWENKEKAFQPGKTGQMVLEKV